MLSTTDPTSLPNDPLRLDRCPECGYLLVGLPADGNCPECGLPYNRSMIVLYGYGFGQHGNVNNVRNHQGPRLILSILGMTFYGFVMWPRGTSRGLVIWAIVVGLHLLAYARRRQVLAHAPAPCQLRLFPAGYAQRDGIGPARLRSWAHPKEKLTISHPTAGICQIRIGKPVRAFRLAPTPTVEFEFACDDETVDRLQKVINAWREQASIIS